MGVEWLSGLLPNAEVLFPACPKIQVMPASHCIYIKFKELLSMFILCDKPAERI